MKRLRFVLVAAAALTASLPASAAGSNSLFIHNRSLAAVKYAIKEAGSSERGCVEPGASVREEVAASIQNVVFEFQEKGSTCEERTETTRSETHPYASPSTAYYLLGRSAATFHVLAGKN